MQENDNKVLPQWALRVKKEKIRRLYALDAQGIHDDDLMDEVGYALLARCESFLTANQAREGSLPCPVCGNTVLHQRDKEEIMRCVDCGWELSWGDYFATIQHKQLSGAEPVLALFASFVDGFTRAGHAREKMFQIDTVLHGFHYWITREKVQETRPVAVNLIDGKLPDVIDFLDQLTYGADSTAGVREKYQEWFQRSQYARSWSLWDGKAWNDEGKGENPS